MRALIWIVAATAVFSGSASAESRLGSILKSVARPQTQSAAGTLTQTDAAAGLREALRVSAVTVTDKLGQQNGFFGDARVKIPLPGALGKAQRSLQPLGLAGPLDDLQLRVNRGAEAAMPQAKTLFVNAVRNMTVSDALSIVRGGNDSGTRYLREKSEAQLVSLLRPQMETALAQAGAFTALDSAAARIGGAGFAGGLGGSAGGAVTNLRGELINFAVAKALDGAFGYIADEERAIRSDPVKRTSDILRRVFGSQG